MMELQSLIPFAAFDAPVINGGGDSMTKGTQIMLLTKLCFGDDDDDIANSSMSYVDLALRAK